MTAASLFVLAMALGVQPATRITSTRPPSEAQLAEYRTVAEYGCRRGNQQFCYDLAGMLRFGAGGPADTKRADRLLRTACRQGHKAGCSKVKR